MSEIDEKDESDEDEEESTDGRDVGSVKHEEFVGDEEGEESKDAVEEEFGSPPAVNVKERDVGVQHLVDRIQQILLYSITKESYAPILQRSSLSLCGLYPNQTQRQNRVEYRQSEAEPMNLYPPKANLNQYPARGYQSTNLAPEFWNLLRCPSKTSQAAITQKQGLESDLCTHRQKPVTFSTRTIHLYPIKG